MNSFSETAKLRLLFLSSIPRWGGGERWMVDAAAGLAARGHDVLLAARHGAQLLDRARDVGLPHRGVTMGGDLHPRALVDVRSLLQSHKPHAVFVNLDKELRYVCLATLGSARPLVFQRRGSDDALKSGLVRRWTYTRCATRIITNSETLAQKRLLAPDWMPRDRVCVLRNGVPTPRRDIPLDRSAVRRTLRVPRRKTLVVHVGELQARKGQETTLEALALLRARSDNPERDPAVPHVLFVGTGPDEALLRDRCHALGVQSHVLWFGFRTNVDEYLAAADVCVLPSRAEGTPWTVLEAMAQGTPVVASAVSGVPEIIEDDVNGLLVAPGDARALADSIRHLMEDTDRAQRLARTALRDVDAHWSADAMLDDLECLVLSELLRRRHAGTADAARRATRAALLVDRDGTLVHNIPYNGDPSAVRLLPDAGRALRWVREAGIPIAVVTNQSGIARGFHGVDEVHAVHARTRELLGTTGADLDALYFCPHHPEYGPACDCRKPLPGLLLQAIRELDLTPGDCWMVGDAQRDLDAGHAAHVPAVGLAVIDAGARQDGAAAPPDDLPTAHVPDPVQNIGIAQHDFAPHETVYRRWTAVVRDFLYSRWATLGVEEHHGNAAQRAARVAPKNNLESSTRSK